MTPYSEGKYQPSIGKVLAEDTVTAIFSNDLDNYLDQPDSTEMVDDIKYLQKRMGVLSKVMDLSKIKSLSKTLVKKLKMVEDLELSSPFFDKELNKVKEMGTANNSAILSGSFFADRKSDAETVTTKPSTLRCQKTVPFPQVVDHHNMSLMQVLHSLQG